MFSLFLKMMSIYRGIYINGIHINETWQYVNVCWVLKDILNLKITRIKIKRTQNYNSNLFLFYATQINCMVYGSRNVKHVISLCVFNRYCWPSLCLKNNTVREADKSDNENRPTRSNCTIRTAPPTFSDGLSMKSNAKMSLMPRASIWRTTPDRLHLESRGGQFLAGPKVIRLKQELLRRQLVPLNLRNAVLLHRFKLLLGVEPITHPTENKQKKNKRAS